MRHVAARVGRAVVVVLAVTFCTFALLTMAPGDPAEQRAGMNATPEVVAEIRSEMGLDDPLLVRYLRWLGDAVRFDFGEAIGRQGFSVATLIRTSLPKTLELMALAELIALGVAVPLALTAARKPGGRIDQLAGSSVFLLLAIPTFVFGIYLQYVFGVRLGWFPVIASDMPGFERDPLGNLHQYLLPSITLASALIAIYVRILRSDVIETMQQDYIMLAQARGIDDRRLLFRHVLRPSSINTVTAVGLQVAGLIGGAFVIEVLFAIPGIGRLLIDSVGQGDYNVVAAIVALVSVGYVAINTVIDVIYSVLDPRIRHATA
jgi:peptide/nickel transport system permease protein